MFGRHRRGLSPILLIPTMPYLCEIGEVKEISISPVLKKTYNRLLLVITKIRFNHWLLLIFVFRFLKNLQVIMTTILKSFRALSTIVMLQGLFLCIILYVERSYRSKSALLNRLILREYAIRPLLNCLKPLSQSEFPCVFILPNESEISFTWKFKSFSYELLCSRIRFDREA